MKILLNNIDLNEALKSVSNLGFVPTMGSIHKGHIYLIKRSKKFTSKTIVSIFINPKQFNEKEDYKKYPKNIKSDLKILRKLKVDYLYLPSIKSVFGNIKRKKFILLKKDKILCAKFRKGHFEGVLEVMDRLTDLIKPTKIFMGEKDYQQLYLVKRFIEKKYKSKIIACKTIRDRNKLALSSRNLLLRGKELQIANKVTQNLIKFKNNMGKKFNFRKLLKNKVIQLEQKFKINVEYLDLRNKTNLKQSKNIKNSKIFIAYYINKIRLIDNF